MAKARRRPLTPIGWREWVALPDLSAHPIKAKIDTGAQTSSLHAYGLVLHDNADGTTSVSFEVHPHQDSARDAQQLTLPVVAFKRVRPSTGRAERRPVIRTPIEIGGARYDIDITLTSRDAMGFRMLIGRAALRRRFMVDSGHSFLLGEPQ